MRALLSGTETNTRLLTYAEFEDAFERRGPRVVKAFHQVEKMFDESFSPVALPVFWRVLVSQYFCYFGLRKTRDKYRDARGSSAVAVADPRNIFDAVATADHDDLDYGAEGASAAVTIGKRYLAHALESKDSFQKCSECRTCTKETSPSATAHGV